MLYNVIGHILKIYYAVEKILNKKAIMSQWVTYINDIVSNKW